MTSSRLEHVAFLNNPREPSYILFLCFCLALVVSPQAMLTLELHSIAMHSTVHLSTAETACLIE